MLQAGDYLQGRYRIIRPHGKGGMGRVYEAFDEAVECLVAIKETLVTTQELQNAFRAEAKLLANLRHPALPRVTHHFKEANGLFLVMDFVDGDSLDRVLEKRNTPFTYPEALNIAEKLFDAVQYLHSFPEPIIHRDIKPANIKHTDDGKTYLLDFGLAKGVPNITETSASEVESVYGYSANYSPLEQITGAGTTVQSDIFSIGATLYTLLTSRTPESAGSRYNTIEEELPDPLVPANEIVQNVPIALSNAIEKAMSLSPRRRYKSVIEMRRTILSAARVGNTRMIRTRTTLESLAIPEPVLDLDGSEREQTESIRATVAIPMPEDELTLADSSPFHRAKTYFSRVFTTKRTQSERFQLALIPEPRRSSIWTLSVAAILATGLTLGFLGFAYMSTREANSLGDAASGKPVPSPPNSDKKTENDERVERGVTDLMNSATELVGRGIELKEQGRRKEAWVEFGKAEQKYVLALDIKPEDARLHAGLGFVYLNWEKWADAHDAFISAMFRDPTNSEYPAQLEKLDSKLGEKDKKWVPAKMQHP